MKWTKQKPTKTGYYWYKDEFSEAPVIGRVDKDKGLLYFDNGEISFNINDDEDETSRWAGPIPEPKG